jgi:predicted nucleic acid-binding protein
MTRSMSNVVFDSHAILKFAQDEPGADQVEALLTDAEKGTVQAFISEINLGEVYYITARRMGVDLARRFLDHFSALVVERVPASWEIILSAAEMKARHALSYADCFAVATALKYDAAIVTGDPEFRKIEHLVKIDWV